MNAQHSAMYPITSADITFCWSKWDGGADGKGKYHVWAMSAPGDWGSGLLCISQSAVVDDFGNLVKVPS